MSEDEKLQHGEGRKAAAGNLFKDQRFELALKSYSSVISLFNSVDKFEESNKTKANLATPNCAQSLQPGEHFAVWATFVVSLQPWQHFSTSIIAESMQLQTHSRETCHNMSV